MKYLTLPTWCALQLLIHDMPDHPYAHWYPTLDDWATESPVVYRLIDAALIALFGAFCFNLFLTFIS
jgi:hypothetical protein